MPNIQIEVLNISADEVSAVFYYDVPVNNQLTGAVDNTRTQPGTRLDAAGVTGLQAGTVHFLVVSRNVVGKTPAQIAAMLQSEYTAASSIALADYQNKYTNRQHLGKAYNGTTWS